MTVYPQKNRSSFPRSQGNAEIKVRPMLTDTGKKKKNSFRLSIHCFISFIIFYSFQCKTSTQKKNTTSFILIQWQFFPQDPHIDATNFTAQLEKMSNYFLPAQSLAGKKKRSRKKSKKAANGPLSRCHSRCGDPCGPHHKALLDAAGVPVTVSREYNTRQIPQNTLMTMKQPRRGRREGQDTKENEKINTCREIDCGSRVK